MLEMTTAKNAAVLSLACRAETNSIVAGTELVSSQAAVVFWDIRSPRDHRLQYVESHNDDVTELQFHPTQESVLLSGSTDGLVNVYDMTITDEDDAVLQVINHGSIHHAGFLSEHAIYALSHDESFSIHPTTDPDNTAQDPGPIRFGDLRQHLSCEYVVQTLTSGQGTHLAAGNTTEKRLDLVPLMPNPQWQFDQSNVSRLLGAHGEEIIRSLYLDEQWGSIFTCGEDGLVRAWKPDDASTGQDDLQGAAHQEEAATSNTKLPQAKKDRKKPKDEKRFRPYHIK
jgi:WD40 repeat protein